MNPATNATETRHHGFRGFRWTICALLFSGGPHRTWFSERQPLPTAGRRLLTFVFPAPAKVHWSATGSLRLCVYDASGAELHAAAAFADNAAKELRLAYDLNQSRTLSRLVIHWQQAAPR